jgi:hypothetical protein
MQVQKIIIRASLALIIFAISACARRTTPTQDPGLVETIPPIPATEAPVGTITPASKPSDLPSIAATLTIVAPVEASPFMGIQVLQMGQNAQIERFYESGANWSRSDYMHWDTIEPENTDPKTYQWDTVDEAGLLAAVEGGRLTIANVLFAPSWAQKYPGIDCGPISREAFDDFARFMSELVRRYGKPPYEVKYWEIGNEPDIDRALVDPRSFYGCWGEKTDLYYGGRYYGEMLKVVYPAIKAADPQAKVIVGSLVLDCDPVNPIETETGSGVMRDCASSRFLEGILDGGGGEYFDGVGFHAYDYYYGQIGSYGSAGWHSSFDTSGPVLIAKARYLKSLLTKYGFRDKELLNTELAVLCGRDGREDYCQGEDFINTKAYYITQSNAAALAEGLRANIWYNLTGWRGSGLLDSKAQPNAAFLAYQFAASQLDRAVYDGNVDNFEGVKGYKFTLDGRSFWLVWSLDGKEHPVSLPEKPAAVLDVFGKPADIVSSDNKLKVSIAPVYVQWGP